MKQGWRPEKGVFGRYFLLVVEIALCLFFGLLQPRFLTGTNFVNIISMSAVPAIMAMSAIFAMACGEMNFALGAQATLGAVVVGWILDQCAMPYALAALISTAVVVAFGVFAIWISLRIGMASFVSSLGVSTIITGIITLLTNGQVMFSSNWGDHFIFLGQASVLGVPVVFLVFLAVAVLCWLFFDKTPVGNHIEAVGNNRTACGQVGINTGRIKVMAFAVSSALAAFSGILYASQTKAVSPALGDSIMMNAIAVAMLSATFLRPGRLNIQGSVISAILLTTIQNGVISIGAPNLVKDVIQGLVLIIAVGYIALTRKEGLPSVSMT